MSASAQRLFHVIVIGGIGLAELAGCGGETTGSTGSPGGAAGANSSSAGGAAGFPREGPPPGSTSVVTTSGGGSNIDDAGNTGSGGASAEDARSDVARGGGGFAGFPMEGPNPCGPFPPLGAMCPDAARDRQAPDVFDAADATVDVGTDSFPREGPPRLPDL
jgi:hypothetical protein